MSLGKTLCPLLGTEASSTMQAFAGSRCSGTYLYSYCVINERPRALASLNSPLVQLRKTRLDMTWDIIKTNNNKPQRSMHCVPVRETPGYSHFSFIRRLGSGIYRSPPKISRISSTPKIFGIVATQKIPLFCT